MLQGKKIYLFKNLDSCRSKCSNQSDFLQLITPVSVFYLNLLSYLFNINDAMIMNNDVSENKSLILEHFDCCCSHSSDRNSFEFDFPSCCTTFIDILGKFWPGPRRGSW